MNWFLRDGRAVSEKDAKKVSVNKDGVSGAFYEDIPCSRCGGLGGHEVWKHTGWTCYRCGAATRRIANGLFSDPSGPLKIKVYTEEKLQKLNAAKEKRRQKKTGQDRCRTKCFHD